MHSEDSSLSKNFRRLRIAVLLFILATVAISAWQSQRKVSSWKSTLYVALYPINADGSAASQKQIDALQQADADKIAAYLDEQGKQYGLTSLYPVRVTLGPSVTALPPELPTSGSMLNAISWSLRMRYWAWRHTPKTSIRPDIRMYLLYVDPATHNTAPDSVGVAKGHFGLAYLFASRDMQGSNLVVATHELLHTLGATDKYDPANNMPLFPDGYADPQRNPALPQSAAEIMAGRIPVDDTHANTPTSLADTVIGTKTATEIGWLKAGH